MATTKKATATRKTAAKKVTPKKVDTFAKVKDIEGTSAHLAYELWEAAGTFEIKARTLAPVLAKRVAAGEVQADIARGLVAEAKEQGRTISFSAANMQVSRYVRMGKELAKDSKADMGTLAKSVMGNASKKRGAGKKNGSEKQPATVHDLVVLASQATATAIKALEALAGKDNATLTSEGTLLLKSLEAAAKHVRVMTDGANAASKATAAK